MRNMLLVAGGGAFGSVLRWLTSTWIARNVEPSRFPWGTLVVNLVGAFAIGALLTLTFEHELLPDSWRLFLVPGVLGGFTTFSAFSWEALTLIRDGNLTAATGYVLGSVVGGLLAATAGMMMLRR
jgi:fluoride exporter